MTVAMHQRPPMQRRKREALRVQKLAEEVCVSGELLRAWLAREQLAELVFEHGDATGFETAMGRP